MKSNHIHFPEIDIIKGISILLVVMGHTISDETPECIAYIITVFTMPLFMMVSGFLFNINEEWSVFLRKKTLRLLIPYLSFSVLTYLMRFLGGTLVRSGQPSVGEMIFGILTGENYWFLYALFLIMLVVKILHKRVLVLTLSAISLVCAYFVDDSIFIINRLVVHPFFFIVGFLFKDIYPEFKTFVNAKHTLLALIIISTSIFTFSSILLGTLSRVHITPLAGCAMIWIISIFISIKLENLSKIISHFGKYSLQYYLNHLKIVIYPLYKYSHIFPNPVVALLFFSFIKISLSYVALLIERRFTVLRILSGIPPKKVNVILK